MSQSNSGSSPSEKSSISWNLLCAYARVYYISFGLNNNSKTVLQLNQLHFFGVCYKIQQIRSNVIWNLNRLPWRPGVMYFVLKTQKPFSGFRLQCQPLKPFADVYCFSPWSLQIRCQSTSSKLEALSESWLWVNNGLMNTKGMI